METNTIYCGDCLDVLRRFPDGCVDLIYLDPPFFSNRHYEIIWRDGAEIRSFGDRWKGGIHHYVSWMMDRLEQCHRVLKKRGSIYVHLDWHAVHYLKVALDKLFDQKNFRNEIVWRYKRWSNVSKNYQRMHDTILFYSKTNNYTFNIQYQPYSQPEAIEDTVRGFINGKLQRLRDKKGSYIKREKENIGVPLHDVFEIQHIQPTSKERLGFPTQKPKALLERIIKVSSNKGDIVLDPFCGCGTAIVVAQELGRKWVGIDVSPTACKLMAKRTRLETGFSPHIISGSLTISELKKYNPFDFQNWVCEKLGGRVSDRRSSDMGIDGWTLDATPVQVKQSERIGRNVVDNFQSAIRRKNKKKGIIVAFSFGRGAYDEVARLKNAGEVEIKLIGVKELLEKK